MIAIQTPVLHCPLVTEADYKRPTSWTQNAPAFTFDASLLPIQQTKNKEEQTGPSHLSKEWNCTGSTRWAWTLAAGSGWDSGSSSRPSTGDATKLFRISLTLMPLLVWLILMSGEDFSSSAPGHSERISVESFTSDDSASTSSFVVSGPPTLWSKSDPFSRLDPCSSPVPKFDVGFSPLSKSFMVSSKQTQTHMPIIIMQVHKLELQHSFYLQQTKQQHSEGGWDVFTLFQIFLLHLLQGEDHWRMISPSLSCKELHKTDCCWTQLHCLIWSKFCLFHNKYAYCLSMKLSAWPPKKDAEIQRASVLLFGSLAILSWCDGYLHVEWPY